jgi:hypothetical protein
VGEYINAKLLGLYRRSLEPILLSTSPFTLIFATISAHRRADVRLKVGLKLMKLHNYNNPDVVLGRKVCRWINMVKIDKFASILASRPNSLLFLTFLIIVLIKSAISLKFQSPWLFQDEMAYAKMAENVLSSEYSGYPPLYPFSLSFAYFFSTDKYIIYHIMLLINSIINSSVLFPSYFFMRRYCSKDYALASSIAVALLPCLVIYNFMLMCENLFLPLFIFSIWFLLEAYRTKTKFWIAMAVSSVSLLFFTKHSGFSMLFGLVVSGLYYLSADLKYDKIKLMFKITVSSKYKLFLIAFISIAFLIIHRIINDNPTFRGYIKREIYYVETYSNVLAHIFSDINSLKEISFLLLHELEYLIISSYFVIFLVMAISLFFILIITRGISLNIIDYGDLAELRRDKALMSSIIYFLFSSIALVIAVVVSNYQMIQSLHAGYSYLYLVNRDDFQLVGRYIDPLVPAIFLFGLIGLFRVSWRETEIRLKAVFSIVLTYLVTCFLFTLTFPFDTNKDVFPILYLRHLESLMPTWIIVPVIMPIFLVGLYLSLCDRKYRSILLLIIILFSIIISAYTVPLEVAASKGFKDQNQIGSYLEHFSNDRSLILMDLEDDARDRVMLPFTKFWATGKVVTYHTAKDPSGVYTDYARNVSYIISSKILPYKTVAYSTRGYLLYKPARIKDSGPRIGFDKTEGWNNMELWNGLPTSWMKGDAILTVYSDRTFPASLSFSVVSSNTYRSLQVFYRNNFLTQLLVPTGFVTVSIPIDLKLGANQVHFKILEGCQRPIDIPGLNNTDSRCLSVAIQNLSICERKENSSLHKDVGLQKEQSSTKFVYGWHGPENWNGSLVQWMDSDAAIIVYSEDNRTTEFSFQALSFVRPRSLVLSSGALPGVELNVTTNFTTLRLPIRLTKGQNLIKFSVPDGCEKPCDIPKLNNSDCRCLSLAVQNINITQ